MFPTFVILSLKEYNPGCYGDVCNMPIGIFCNLLGSNFIYDTHYQLPTHFLDTKLSSSIQNYLQISMGTVSVPVP